MIKEIIELVFSAALFLNALLFVPQAVRILIEKSAKGVSLTTFLGFLVIQMAIILHAISAHDSMLMIGYMLSLITCGSVVVLALFYRRYDETKEDAPRLKQETADHLDFLENVIAEMPGNVYWMNRQGIYLGCNDNQAKVIGLQSRKDIVGKRNVDIPGFLIPEALDPINEKVMQTAETIVTEEPAILPNGKHITVLSSKVPIKNRRKEVVGMVGISIDITDRKKAELGELAAQVAHDIRSPLQVLEELFGKMKYRFADAESQVCSDAIRRIHHIAAELLAKYRLDKKSNAKIMSSISQKFLPSEIIFLALQKIIEEKKITLSHYQPTIVVNLAPIEDKTLSARFDIAELQRIISNIINNAVEAFDAHNTVVRSITLSLTAADNRAIISITDNGKGISHARVAKFNNAEGIESQGGHGLGLSHALTTLHEWGGDLKMQSILGEGTVIRIYLPLAPPPVWLCLNLSLPEDTLFYLVDDDPTTRYRLTDMLVKQSVKPEAITACHTLDEFLVRYASDLHPHRFVFMDQLFVKTERVGIDVLIENKLQENSALITNDFSDSQLKQYAIDHEVGLIPKPLFGDLRIAFEPLPDEMVRVETPIENVNLEYIVLDDLTSVTGYWRLQSEEKNIAIKTFNNSRDFMEYIPYCNKNVKIYVDNDLREKLSGLEITQKLSGMGFKNLYMMTSRDDIKAKNYPWLTAVVSKKVPFDE
ncbi:MAG: PAS domain-containing protein [Gammaproteobacteria bacterium]|nr:PAS domain-containing protein [Gammaproteobacteria bacterium]